MASTPDTLAAGAAPARSGVSGRNWLPSLFDLMVVSLPAWYFTAGDGGLLGLLVDGDTGWHTRTGDWIRQNASFVYRDIFSISKPGEPWFAWEWLCDVLFSLLSQWAGWKGLAVFGIVLSTAFFGITFRHLVWRGANIYISLSLSLLVFGASTVHLLSRPHLWTMVFLAAAAFLIQKDLRRPARWLWALVPLTALWANLHGGWLAGVALLGLTAVGSALESRLRGGSWRAGVRYAAAAALCLAASLLNPYGWGLHQHTLAYLRADWIKEFVSEFQSPSFRGEMMMQYELLLLAAAAATGLMLRRKQFVGPLWMLFWAHQSLVSARHVTLFAAVAAPFIADELQRAWSIFVRRSPRNSTPRILDTIALEARPAISRMTVWLIIPFFLAVLPGFPINWPADAPSLRFPAKMIAAHKEFLKSRRLFIEDYWAGYLIYHSYPNQKVFFDGRTDFYGEALTKDYLAVIHGKHRWKEILDRYRIDAVLVKPRWAVATMLKTDPQWRVVADDTQAILLERITPPGWMRAQGVQNPGGRP